MVEHTLGYSIMSGEDVLSNSVQHQNELRKYDSEVIEFDFDDCNFQALHKHKRFFPSITIEGRKYNVYKVHPEEVFRLLHETYWQ
jgi:hypothetical protein